ncbi:MAG: hypothetical protein AAGI66_10060, partial [Cyanobacteria bacterium P01_H01_bin.74]
ILTNSINKNNASEFTSESSKKLHKSINTREIHQKNTIQGVLHFESTLGKTFIPERAFEAVKTTLRRQESINYQLFKAIVLAGGKARTEEIKAYLIENNIVQPASGENFEAVPLTDISSRVSYLVRKNLVEVVQRGVFQVTVGWVDSAN